MSPLRAGAVSLNNAAIGGRIVDSQTGNPITGATVIVMAEQADAAGVDRMVAQTLASSSHGTFFFCPLSAGNYDIVAAARTLCLVGAAATGGRGAPTTGQPNRDRPRTRSPDQRIV